MENNNDFLPQGYVAPQANTDYLKLQKGENKFRILSKPIIGWLDWKDKQPLRYDFTSKPTPIDHSKPVKHFWAFIVWNYNENKIQILELTQSSIQNRITALAKNSDWGSPFGYDIKITKTGDGMTTEYAVDPVPHKPCNSDILNEAKKKPCDLTALFVGGNPFDKPKNITKIEATDIPF